ncbi:carbohydrate ABC transporter permease [Microbacterium sp. NPDC057407]|uniref:carbohydrate ABC transporter permease n=1 Tax=Microbacterium sp. NPDC057407 TaxID=3346120 RepID=UPI00366C30BA
MSSMPSSETWVGKGRTLTRGFGPSRRKPLTRSTAAFLVPGGAMYLVFVLVPLVLSFYYSFTNRNLLYPGEQFVGAENYVRLLTNPTFLGSFAFTATLTIVTVIVVNAAGLGIALLLNRTALLFRALRIAFFVPVALSGVVVAFIWSTILTDQGLLNASLDNLGLGFLAQSWLGNPVTAQGSVIAVTSWQAIGLCTVIYLAGLQTIPSELRDAAKIDGAGAWSEFRHVTWPLLAPSLTINTTLLLINGFKTYDIPVVLTGTGPGGATSTVATEVIRVGFNLNRVGSASAMAVVMLVVTAVATFIVVGYLRKRELER